MNDALHMLIGASLVMLGVLVTAVADRIRGLRTLRGRAEREAPARPPLRAEPAVVVAPELDSREQRTDRVRGMRPPAPPSYRDDVITALVGAGYRKIDATVAANACVATERGSLENWTRAALRRANGGAS